MEPDMVHSPVGSAFDEPSTDRFLYAGWRVDPPTRLPIVRRSDERQWMIERCRDFAAATQSGDGAVTATVYETEMIPPLPGVPRYDVLMLIRSRARSRVLHAESGLRDLEPQFRMLAQNTRRIGDTDSTRSASFLFNHFVAQRPAAAMEGFDRVAGWFPDKLGVDNTTLLQPVDPTASPFAFVNYVRVPGGARRFLLAMLTRPTFYTHVRRTLRAHGMIALPLLAKPV